MERQIYYGLRITYLFVGRTFLYHFELLLLQKAEAVAQFSNLFFSKVPAWSYRFNIKMVLFKTLLTMYPKNKT